MAHYVCSEEHIIKLARVVYTLAHMLNNHSKKTKLNAFILSRFRLIQEYKFPFHRSDYLTDCQYIWLIRCEAGLHAGNCNRTG